jgi:hypothetical protein
MSEKTGIVYDKSPSPGPSKVPHPTASMPEGKQDLQEMYKGSTPAGVEPIDYIEEAQYGGHRQIIRMHADELPHYLKTQLQDALVRGQSHLAQSLGHHIAVLDGGELADRTTIASLKRLRAELTGEYENDREVLSRVSKVLSTLRPTKR